MKENIQFPIIVPILVQDDLFIYPFMIAPIYINDNENIQAVDKAMNGNDLILIASPQETADNSLYNVGVLGSIMRKVAMPDGKTKLLFQGLYRAKILKITNDNPTEALIDTISYKPYEENTANALLEILREKVRVLANISQRFPPDLLKTIEDNHEPNRIIDLVASSMRLKKDLAYTLFAKDSIPERLELIIEYVMEEIQAQRIQKEIKSKVHDKMEQINKEYFLKEQLKLIQKELGESPKDEEIQRYRDKIESLKAFMGDDAYKEIKKQIDRLSRMHQDSADANLLQNYIEWCLEIPFDKVSKTKISINSLQKQLDSDHYSLHKPKERIVEYFAVRELALNRKKDSKNHKGTILCFYGPPGVGKTSLANSIAKATKRQLVRIALGGLEDVNELRGHRRTYIGAMPGRITQGLIEAKEMNPVVVLDEIDKVGKSYRGDPTSALLEILDPEQNTAFRDYYTNFNLDLSQIIFIATANDISTIPAPLRDRMEFIELTSYTPEEKFQIARKYLIPQELEKHALKRKEVTISTLALKQIIEKYTREAGVRGLRRVIATIMRKSAKEIVRLDSSKHSKITVTPRNLKQFLDKIVFEIEEADKQNKIGVTNGLAWTTVGGDVLKIEAIKIKGKGELTLTGSLGDVMKESAKIAHSVIKTLFDQKILQPKDKTIDKDMQIYNLYNVHLHIPEGATPKDGPSAGITMACAIASILSDSYVRADIAMTGELTLTGAILPIGGLKEKLIAAYKAKIKTVLIPQKNYERDLEDMDKEVLENLQIIGVKTIREVLKKVLV